MEFSILVCNFVLCVVDEQESASDGGLEHHDLHGPQRAPDPRSLPLLARLLHRSALTSSFSYFIPNTAVFWSESVASRICNFRPDPDRVQGLGNDVFFNITKD
jgi:hypothetical protein